MARIRTIKPEFWTDETVVELSIPARLFFIGLWNHADDAGNLVYSPRKLKMQIFPADTIDCEGLLGELITHGLITVYSVNVEEFIHINGFRKHQVINRPSKTTIPPPERRDGPPKISEHSRTERKGKEGNIYKHPDSETLPCAEPPTVGGRDDFGRGDQNAEIERIRTTVWRQHGLTDDQIATKRASASVDGVRQAVAWLKLLDGDTVCAAIEDAFSAAEARGERINRPWAYLDAVVKSAAEAAAGPVPETEVLDRSQGGRTLVEWETSVALFQKSGFWHGQSWGPKPGDAGCRVPGQILQNAGLA